MADSVRMLGLPVSVLPQPAAGAVRGAVVIGASGLGGCVAEATELVDATLADDVLPGALPALLSRDVEPLSPHAEHPAMARATKAAWPRRHVRRVDGVRPILIDGRRRPAAGPN